MSSQASKILEKSGAGGVGDGHSQESAPSIVEKPSLLNTLLTKIGLVKSANAGNALPEGTTLTAEVYDHHFYLIVAGIHENAEAATHELRKRGFRVEYSEEDEDPAKRKKNGLNMVVSFTQRIVVKLAIRMDLPVQRFHTYSYAQKVALSNEAVKVVLRTRELQGINGQPIQAWVSSDKHLSTRIKLSSSQLSTLDSIHKYFGTKVALYFGWLEKYTTDLQLPTIVGTLLFLHQLLRGNVDSILVPVFCVFICLWGTYVLEYSKRRMAVLSFTWGVHGVEDDERNVEVVKAISKQSPNRVLRKVLSFTATLSVMWALIQIMLTYAHLQAHAAAIYGEKSWLRHYPSVVYAVIPYASGWLFLPIAKKLNDFEANLTKADAENSLILKTFALHFINRYSGLLYTAFVLQDLITLRSLLVSLLTVYAVLDNLIEITDWQWVKSKVFPPKKKGKDCDGSENKASNNTSSSNSTGSGSGSGNVAQNKVATVAQQGSGAALASLNVDPEKQRLLAEAKALYEPLLNSELARTVYDINEDYLEMVLQFGYITMFAVAFPLAPLLALVRNYIEFKVDVFKLMHHCRKPPMDRRSDIGAWQWCLEFISFASVVTNCFLLAMVSTHFDLVVPIGLVLSLSSYTTADADGDSAVTAGAAAAAAAGSSGVSENDSLHSNLGKFVTMLVLEHALLAIKVAMMLLIDEVPKQVQEAVAIRKVRHKIGDARARLASYAEELEVRSGRYQLRHSAAHQQTEGDDYAHSEGEVGEYPRTHATNTKNNNNNDNDDNGNQKSNPDLSFERIYNDNTSAESVVHNNNKKNNGTSGQAGAELVMKVESHPSSEASPSGQRVSFSASDARASGGRRESHHGGATATGTEGDEDAELHHPHKHHLFDTLSAPMDFFGNAIGLSGSKHGDEHDRDQNQEGGDNETGNGDGGGGYGVGAEGKTKERVDLNISGTVTSAGKASFGTLAHGGAATASATAGMLKHSGSATIQGINAAGKVAMNAPKSIASHFGLPTEGGRGGAATRAAVVDGSPLQDGDSALMDPTAAAIARMNEMQNSKFGFDPIMMMVLIFTPIVLQYLHISPFLYVPFAVLFFSYLKAEKDRADSQAAIGMVGDPAIMKLILGNLPSWVSDSEYQQVEWLNSILDKLWIHVSRIVERKVLEIVQPQLDAATPVVLAYLKLKHVSLGTIAPKIVGIRFFKTEDTIMRLDIELKWQGDPLFSLKVGTLPIPITVELNKLSITGMVRIELLDINSHLPCFRALSVTNMQKPFVDFSLTVASLDVANIGASEFSIMQLIRGIIHNALSGFMLYPKKLIIPMAPGVDVEALAALTPVGILTLTIERGIDLKMRKVMGMKVSDPIVQIETVEIATPLRTKCKRNTSNPVWNETFELTIYDKVTQEISLTVIDGDLSSMDQSLGHTVFTLEDIPVRKQVEKVIRLSDTPKGSLQVSMFYTAVVASSPTAAAGAAGGGAGGSAAAGVNHSPAKNHAPKRIQTSAVLSAAGGANGGGNGIPGMEEVLGAEAAEAEEDVLFDASMMDDLTDDMLLMSPEELAALDGDVDERDQNFRRFSYHNTDWATMTGTTEKLQQSQENLAKARAGGGRGGRDSPDEKPVPVDPVFLCRDDPFLREKIRTESPHNPTSVLFSGDCDRYHDELRTSTSFSALKRPELASGRGNKHNHDSRDGRRSQQLQQQRASTSTSLPIGRHDSHGSVSLRRPVSMPSAAGGSGGGGGRETESLHCRGGLVTVSQIRLKNVHSAHTLEGMFSGRTFRPFVRFNVGDLDPKETEALRGSETSDSLSFPEQFSFLIAKGASVLDLRLTVQVLEKQKLFSHKLLGRVHVLLEDVVKSAGGVLEKEFALDKAATECFVGCKIQWSPRE